MVIDTSAIIAVIAGEPDHQRYLDAIANSELNLISAVTLLETRIVLLARFGPAGMMAFDELMSSAEITVAPFDELLATTAFEAFDRYGKGRGHPAQLNIIDCAAYALARSRELPLLFKGGDFSRTDVMPALATGSAV